MLFFDFGKSNQFIGNPAAADNSLPDRQAAVARRTGKALRRSNLVRFPLNRRQLALKSRRADHHSFLSFLQASSAYSHDG